MGNIRHLALAASAALIIGAGSAHATTISLGDALNALVPVSTLASGSGPGPVSVPSGTTNGGYIITGEATDFFPKNTNLDSNTIDVSASAGNHNTLFFYATETGLVTSGGNRHFDSTFTSNQLPTGWSLTEWTFLDNSDTPFGLGTLLSSHVFTGTGTFDQSVSEPVSVPFSITEIYEFSANGIAGTTNDTIDLSSVPEPSTWAMMLAGFAGLGFLGFRQSRKTRVSIT
jgi:hypothetical protein